jgi:predicted N-formylglutamate amidohydrolase
MGLLFDPRRCWERGIALGLRQSLRSEGLSVRFNYPYSGSSDGLTTTLRRALADPQYAGIEIELNQRLLRSAPGRTRAARALKSALETALNAGVEMQRRG